MGELSGKCESVIAQESRIVVKVMTNEEGNNDALTTLEKFYIAIQNAHDHDVGDIAVPFFRTPFHMSVYDELRKMLQEFHMDNYKGRTGTFSKILPGPRGIGKTNCLRTFASVVPTLCKNTSSFYLSVPSGNSSTIPEDIVSEKSLCKVIAKNLELELEKQEFETMADALVRALGDQRLVVIIDEMERLFNRYKSFETFAYNTLDELSNLANNTSGKLIILLSGSSLRLSEYIKGKLKGELSEEEKKWEVFNHNHDLNGKRYQCLCPTYPEPTSLEFAKAVLHPETDVLSEQERKLVLQKLYKNGIDVRSLDDVTKTTIETAHAKMEGYKVYVELLVLWTALNREILESLDPTTLKMSWWRRKVKREAPIQKRNPEDGHWSDPENPFRPVQINRLFATHGPELLYQLNSLQYGGLVVVVGDRVYPSSIGSLMGNLRPILLNFWQGIERDCYSFSRRKRTPTEYVSDLTDASTKLINKLLNEVQPAG